MATYSSAQTDRGYEGRVSDNPYNNTNPYNIPSPNPSQSSAFNPQTPNQSSQYNVTQPASSGTNYGTSTAPNVGGGLTPEQLFAQQATVNPFVSPPVPSSPNYSSVNPPSPEQFTVPFQHSQSETMRFNQEVAFTNSFDLTPEQSFGGTLNARRTGDFRETAKLPTRSEQFLYEQSQKAQNLQKGNQGQYVAGATLGLGVGAAKFGRDIFYDLTGQGFKQFPLKETGKSFFSLVNEPGPTLKNIGNQFTSNPYESAGYYGAPIILGKLATIGREGFIRTTSTEVPTSKYLDIKTVNAVESGTKTYPSVSNINTLYSDFLRGKNERGNILVSTQSPQPLKNLGQSRYITAGESEFSIRNRESAGIYTSPLGKGNAAFYKIIDSGEIGGLSVVPKISRPTTSIIEVNPSDFGRIPKGILSKGMTSENEFLRNQPGKLYISGNVERAFNPLLKGRATSEYEAVITPGSNLKSTGGFLGYEERVTVSGKAIPIRTYILDKPVNDFSPTIPRRISPSESFNYDPYYNSYVYESRRSIALSDISGISSSKSQPKFIESPSYVPSENNLPSRGTFSGTSYPSKPSPLSNPEYPSRPSSGTSYPSRSLIPSESAIIPSRGESSISRIEYPRYNLPNNVYPSIPIYKERYNNLFTESRKKSKTKVYKVKVPKNELFILPDLFSVSKTENRPGYRAMTPKATLKVTALSYNAFKGYSSGFVPTEQMRKKLKL